MGNKRERERERDWVSRRMRVTRHFHFSLGPGRDVDRVVLVRELSNGRGEENRDSGETGFPVHQLAAQWSATPLDECGSNLLQPHKNGPPV